MSLLLNYMKLNSKVIFFICVVLFLFLSTRYSLPETVNSFKLKIIDKTGLKANENYLSECVKLYKKLRNPDTSYVFDPPVKEIPAELMNEFTENGTVKIEYKYYNDLFKDSASNDKSKINRVISKKDLEYWIQKLNRNEPLGSYDDKELKNMMFKMSSKLKNKTMAVIGTISVWIEAISLAVGCSKITTLDYTRNKYEQPQLEWIHVNDYYDEAIKNNMFETFDNAASFSSLEHAGLGRFGDPISPNGDIDAVKQVHCMLKKGGLFFLAIPVSLDDKYMVSFNGGI